MTAWNEARAQRILAATQGLFDCRRNLVVPNVSHGLPWVEGEIDLLAVAPSGLASEVEIKVSVADLRADLRKAHSHNSARIAYLWFAVPVPMLGDALRHCDTHHPLAGVIALGSRAELAALPMVRRDKCHWRETHRSAVARKAKRRPGVEPLTDAEQLRIARLGVLRFWSVDRKSRPDLVC